MIGIAIVVIIAILLVGLLFKLLKVAIILALGVGIVMFARKTFGRNNDSGRIE